MWLNISLFLIDTWYKTMILNKGMTGIWIARRYWLFFYIEEPIYPSVYHVFGGGARLFLTIFFSFYINSIINGHIKICKSFINGIFSKIDISSRTIFIFV